MTLRDYSEPHVVGSRGDQLARVISSKVTVAEKDMILRAAKLAQTSSSDFIRCAVVLSAMRRIETERAT